MANTTHHVKSDLKHSKQQPQQQARPDEQRPQPAGKPAQKPAPTRPLTPEVEEGFDAPGKLRPPSDS